MSFGAHFLHHIQSTWRLYICKCLHWWSYFYWQWFKDTKRFQAPTKNAFEIVDFRELYHFIGIEVLKSKHYIFITQENFAKEIKKKIKIENANLISTPFVCYEIEVEQI